MRLTCPNCNAQYEVDAAVIPDLGRDVQCSNCGQTWFQAGPLTPEPEREPARPVLEPVSEPVSEPAKPSAETTSDRQSAPEAEFEGWDDGAPPIDAAQPEDDVPQSPPAAAHDPFDEPLAARDGFDTDFDEDYEPTPPANRPSAPAPSPAARRPLDGDLLAVLREEAEREVQARKAEGSALETQPDLGLIAARPVPPPMEREARLSGFDEMPAADAPRVTRRDLLPDIEEINSTLRATSDRNTGYDDDPALDRAKSTGFGLGFGAVLGAVAIGLGGYLGAPSIGAALPSTVPALNRYVASVDGARLWLDAKMSALTQSIRDSSSAGQ